MVILVNNPEPEISVQDIGVYKVLELRPRFPYFSGTFLEKFTWFWKITTPVYEMEIKGRLITPQRRLGFIPGHTPPYLIGEGWINCLYDVIPEMMTTKKTWNRLYQNLKGKEEGKCFLTSCVIPKKTRYFTGKNKWNNFVGIASEKLRIVKVIDFSDTLTHEERRIILNKVRGWK